MRSECLCKSAAGQLQVLKFPICNSSGDGLQMHWRNRGVEFVHIHAMAPTIGAHTYALL